MSDTIQGPRRIPDTWLAVDQGTTPLQYPGTASLMLDQEQIEDLKHQSKEYERQQTIRMRSRRSGSDSEEVDPDIHSIVAVPGRRHQIHQQRQPTYR